MSPGVWSIFPPNLYIHRGHFLPGSVHVPYERNKIVFAGIYSRTMFPQFQHLKVRTISKLTTDSLF
jgi:hypothetical protein